MVKEREKFFRKAKMSIKVGIIIIYLAIATLIFIDVVDMKEFALSLLIGSLTDIVCCLSLFKYFETEHLL